MGTVKVGHGSVPASPGCGGAGARQGRHRCQERLLLRLPSPRELWGVWLGGSLCERENELEDRSSYTVVIC